MPVAWQPIQWRASHAFPTRSSWPLRHRAPRVSPRTRILHPRASSHFRTSGMLRAVVSPTAFSALSFGFGAKHDGVRLLRPAGPSHLLRSSGTRTRPAWLPREVCMPTIFRKRLSETRGSLPCAPSSTCASSLAPPFPKMDVETTKTSFIPSRLTSS